MSGIDQKETHSMMDRPRFAETSTQSSSRADRSRPYELGLSAVSSLSAVGKDTVPLTSLPLSLSVPRPSSAFGPGTTPGKIFGACASPSCRGGWLHPWRSRSGPVFEGGWSCSPVCTTARIEIAVRRELEGRVSDTTNRAHRIPLGLIMLEQGWISSAQLREALELQKRGQQELEPRRLGDLLIEEMGVPEQQVTRALALQWSCPVLPLDFHDPDAMAHALPRLLVEAFQAVPLRIAAGKILYLGFEERLDPVLALAVERMLGLRVETGLVRGSLFRVAQQRMLEAKFPPTELIEAVSEAPLVRALTKAIERVKPVEARLVRVHDLLWMRMWSRVQRGPLPEVGSSEDVLCSLSLS